MTNNKSEENPEFIEAFKELYNRFHQLSFPVEVSLPKKIMDKMSYNEGILYKAHKVVNLPIFKSEEALQDR